MASIGDGGTRGVVVIATSSVCLHRRHDRTARRSAEEKATPSGDGCRLRRTHHRRCGGRSQRSSRLRIGRSVRRRRPATGSPAGQTLAAAERQVRLSSPHSWRARSERWLTVRPTRRCRRSATARRHREGRARRSSTSTPRRRDAESRRRDAESTWRHRDGYARAIPPPVRLLRADLGPPRPQEVADVLVGVHSGTVGLRFRRWGALSVRG